MPIDEFREDGEWAFRAATTLGRQPPGGAGRLPSRKGHVKVKIRYLEGELEGMEEFVHATHLHCPRKGWKRIEKDESKRQALLDYLAGREEVDWLVIEAANEVLAATGEDLVVGYTSGRRYERGFRSRSPLMNEWPKGRRVTCRAGRPGRVSGTARGACT